MPTELNNPWSYQTRLGGTLPLKKGGGRGGLSVFESKRDRKKNSRENHHPSLSIPYFREVSRSFWKNTGASDLGKGKRIRETSRGRHDGKKSKYVRHIAFIQSRRRESMQC